MTEPKKALIYTRVSRDDSGEGKSNERQREDCQKLAELRGWNVVGVEEDISISAYGLKDRPAWQRTLRAVESGSVDVVMAWHIDRMTRNMLDLEELIVLAEEHHVGVATVTGDIDLTTDVGRMVARILAAVARAEVERKGARQRRANEQRAAEGLPWPSGWRPLGYEKDGRVIESEAAHVRQAAEDVLNGASLHSIQRRWAAAGVSTPRSAKGGSGNWTHSGVKAVLLNPRYAGHATHRGKVVGRGQWTAILAPETHTLLVAKLTDPARKQGGAGTFGVPENLLSGIAVCARCGGKVQAGNGHKGARIYQCAEYHTSTYREEADEIVRSAFALTIQRVGLGSVIPVARTTQPSDLLLEAARLDERLTSLSTSFAHGNITIEQLNAASASLRDQRQRLDTRLQEQIAVSDEPKALKSKTVLGFVDSDLSAQRKVLAELAEVTLYPKGKGRKNVPITEQVKVRVKDVRGRWIVAMDNIPEGVYLRLTPAKVE